MKREKKQIKNNFPMKNHIPFIHRDLKLINLRDLEDGVYVITLGGVREIGSNMNVIIAINQGVRTGIILDAGTSVENSFGFNGKLASIEEIKDQIDIKAIVITHSHLDHTGAISYLCEIFPNAAIRTTKFTSLVVKSRLKATLVDSTKIIIEKPNETFVVGLFEIILIGITHSTSDCNMVHISVVIGNRRINITHTGDYRIDLEPIMQKKTDMNFLFNKMLSNGPVDLHMEDSTNSLNNNRLESESTESEVNRNITAEIDRRIQSSHSGLIIISCFSSNVFRVAGIILSAKERGMSIFLCGMSMKNMHKMAMQAELMENFGNTYFDLQMRGLDFFDPISKKTIKRNKVIVICTGSQGEERAILSKCVRAPLIEEMTEEELEKPEKFRVPILLSSLDVVIFSSRKIPGNEDIIADLMNKFVYKNIDVVVDSDSCPIHVSGHPKVNDNTTVRTRLKPTFVLPVHGSPNHLNASIKQIKKMHPEMSTDLAFNGAIFAIIGTNKCKKFGYVNTNYLFQDGKQSIREDSTLIHKRKQLSKNGIIFIHDRFGKNISQIGVIDQNDKKLINKLKEHIRLIIKTENTNDKNPSQKAHIANSIRRFIGKTPYVEFGPRYYANFKNTKERHFIKKRSYGEPGELRHEPARTEATA